MVSRKTKTILIGFAAVAVIAGAVLLYRSAVTHPAPQVTEAPYSEPIRTNFPTSSPLTPMLRPIPSATPYPATYAKPTSDIGTIVANATPAPDNSTITIGSFNIQVFGVSKSEKIGVMDALSSILAQYDVVAIQEIRDSTAQPDSQFTCNGTALEALLSDIKAVTGYEPGCVAGPRLGRTSSKEQYAFLWNPNRVQLLGMPYTYNDKNDTFEREPLIALFKSGNFDFALADIHTKPEDATAEICALTQVIADAQSHYQDNQDVIVLGDYNADGSYFNETSSECHLRQPQYTWAIPNSLDTTVAASSNTYDRMVFPSASTDEDFTGKAGVYDYDQQQGAWSDFFRPIILAQGTDAKNVSDHYPIWAIFYIGKDSD